MGHRRGLDDPADWAFRRSVPVRQAGRRRLLVRRKAPSLAVVSTPASVMSLIANSRFFSPVSLIEREDGAGAFLRKTPVDLLIY
jgi:hypothetical protein